MTSSHPWDPLQHHELVVLPQRNNIRSFTSAPRVAHLHRRYVEYVKDSDTDSPLQARSSSASLASPQHPRRPSRLARPLSSFASLPSPTEVCRPATADSAFHPISPYDYDDTTRLTKVEPPEDLPHSDESQNCPSGIRRFVLIFGLSLAAFIVALDRTIVATAIPRITDEFGAPNDIGWFGSAYLLTSCAFQPTYGRIFVQFNVRWSFLAALALFEVGSLICALAPNAVILIIGRAVAGLGCAGVFAGVLVIVALVIPLRERPIYMGLIGSIFGVGSVCGPILGGVLTDKLTWRWCFYLNLPIGFFTFVALVVFFHPPKKMQKKEGIWTKLMHLDPVGNLLLVTAVIMLLLALQWGGIEYAWTDIKVISLLIGCAIETLVFLGWQVYLKDAALIPLRLIAQRTVAASLLSGFFLSGTLFVHSYYLPYWFQAIKGETAIASGVDTIPYLASNFVCSIIAGGLVTKFGYFNPPALLGAALAAVGGGLITTFSIDMPASRWIGYLIITGAGLGASIQQGVVAVQAVLPDDVVPIVTTLIMFMQSLSGAIFVSVASNIMRNGLESRLLTAQLPGVDIAQVLAAGATEVKDVVPMSQLASVNMFFNDALDNVFGAAVPMALTGFVCSLGMEWKSLKGKKILAVNEG